MYTKIISRRKKLLGGFLQNYMTQEDRAMVNDDDKNMHRTIAMVTDDGTVMMPLMSMELIKGNDRSCPCSVCNPQPLW